MILWTITGIIIVGGFVAGSIYYFSKQPQNLPQGKCGDGVCDQKESLNAKLCPRDCLQQLEKSTSTTSGGIVDGGDNNSANTVSPDVTVKNSYGSSFGVHYGGNMLDTVNDLGAGWTREGSYVIWDWSDSGRNGSYRFTDATAPSKDGSSSILKINYDKQWLSISGDLRLVANVTPFMKGGNFKSDAELATYKDFVQKMAERYDGDNDYGCSFFSVDCYKKGDSQYPSQEVINYFKNNPIKYWQVCNQVTDTCDGTDCKTTYAAKYAKVLKTSYEGIKAADSSSYVLIAGDSTKDYYPSVFNELGGKYIDIIDFHRFGLSSWYDPQSDFDYLKDSLKKSGFDISKLKFWITETGTYSGDPMENDANNNLFKQSEKQQAEGLVKAYVSGFSYGIEKIFWAWGIQEGFRKTCGIFDYTGIIYDGCDCENTKYVCNAKGIGDDLGKGVKKLAYYSYKKMTEKLSGWNSVKTVQKSGGINIYKFTRSGKIIYVTWSDDTTKKTAIISEISSKQIKITEATPKYETGKEVTNYNSAFNETSSAVIGNSVKVEVGNAPVFIEEM